MPNRWIREDAIESETVNAVSWQAEVFWRRLLNRCDDFGRFSANLKLLRAQIFPLQTDKVGEQDVERLLSECEGVGLLFVYAATDGKPYLAMNKWEKGRAKYSKYPDPPDDVRERMKTFVYKCAQTQTNAPTSDFRLPTSGSDTDSDAVVPTPEEIFAYCDVGLGIPKDYCAHYHHKQTVRNGWIRGGRLIRWQLDIPQWWAKDRATWGKNGHSAKRPDTQPTIKGKGVTIE